MYHAEYLIPHHYANVELNTIIVMTFKEDFKPSRVYNKFVIDAINKDIANDGIEYESEDDDIEYYMY